MELLNNYYISFKRIYKHCKETRKTTSIRSEAQKSHGIDKRPNEQLFSCHSRQKKEKGKHKLIKDHESFKHKIMSFETPKDRRSMPNIYRSLHKSHTNISLIYKENI